MKVVKRIILGLMCLGSSLTYAQTQQINGLAVIVDYQDKSIDETEQYIYNLFNQPGFSGQGQTLSIRDYYLLQSNGKVELNTQVIRVSIPQTSTYYHLENGHGEQFMSDIVDAINVKYPNGFTNLTPRPSNGTLWGFTIIDKAVVGAGTAVSGGVQDGLYIKSNNLPIRVDRVNRQTAQDERWHSVPTLAHEIGHGVFDFDDLDQAYSNMGFFCLMEGAGKVDPGPLNPGYRYRNNWFNTVIELNPAVGGNYSLSAIDYDTVYKYTNPYNSKEYLLITNYSFSGLFQSIYSPEQGLAIWYVNEEYGLEEGITPKYQVKLVQADGLDEMHDEDSPDRAGDAWDMFDNLTSVFSSATHPIRWKNGSEIGIKIKNISAPGYKMTFTVEAQPNSIIAQVNPQAGGNIFPNGLIRHNGSQPVSFSIVPDFGYSIQNVLVDGVSVGQVSQYTFNSGIYHTINATFVKNPAVDPITAPWSAADIGGTNMSFSAQRGNQFSVNTNSDDIYWGADQFHFIYQTLNGNGEIVVEVSEMKGIHEWSKAGVMIRETTGASSKHVMLVQTPLKYVNLQYRTETNGGSESNPSNIEDLHRYRLYKYLKLKREGNKFTAYCSRNAYTWVFMGEITIPMNQQVYIGLCTAGHDPDKNDQKNFIVKYSNVQVTVPTVSGLFSQYQVPRTTGLPTGFKQYSRVYSVGTNGPLLNNVFNSVINWWGNSGNPNALYQFSLETNNGNPRYYTNIIDYATYQFANANPEITINSTIGFAGLQGSYWVNFSGNDLVLVRKTGDYAVIFTNIPARQGIPDLNVVPAEDYLVFPNPFVENATVLIPASKQEVKVEVLNASGNLVESTSANDSFTLGESYAPGIYFIKLNDQTSVKTIKVVKR
ncbi:MAG: T9SS type A sorting domain-containing protein [Sporocytophaga sp.]|uniref:T9SS type A sorting domain-containing protein n=1 Tax=Sporocytophaga sp. TaxID=2231183 RepID=UPI001B11C1C8|nr:T9SS type A sorting domain-containing protein [Sporocytophaga sp.]MBO9700374.1 T9SS type A sorting domain-containing protein [Sporocytophaga sp.]